MPIALTLTRNPAGNMVLKAGQQIVGSVEYSFIRDEWCASVPFIDRTIVFTECHTLEELIEKMEDNGYTVDNQL